VTEMTDDERAMKLSRRIRWLWFQIPTRTFGGIARAIIDNPKFLINALLEAEVPVTDILDSLVDMGELERLAGVVRPKGEWVAWYRIPIEGPDDE
jgi:hypothetical protein